VSDGEQGRRLLLIHQAVLEAFGAATLVAAAHGVVPDEDQCRRMMVEPAAIAAVVLAKLGPLSPGEAGFLVQECLVAATLATISAAAAGAIASAVNLATKAHGAS
jgi:hypothetical protein